MTKIITFISPKTAGASSVALNLACLQSLESPLVKVGLLEVSPWNTQSVNFSGNTIHTWQELLAFYNTPEWGPDLLQRASTNLGPEVLWSPTLNYWPVFNLQLAEAWLDILTQRYEVLCIDLNNAVPIAWQQFWLKSSQQVIGVVTPDPVSLQAWENWSQHPKQKNLPITWLLNQASAAETGRLKERFFQTNQPLLGVLRQDGKRFWQQVYLGFPVVWHKRSGFKNDLATVLQKIIKT